MSIPGRVSIHPRAIRRVAEATMADAFGVDAADVRARVQDREGSLDLEVATPSRLPAPLLTTAAAARDQAAAQATHVTGARFAHVRVRITDVHVAERRRVQ